MHKCIICHYWYFHEINFRFQLEVCHICQGSIQQAMSFNDFAIVFAKGNNYRTNFLNMSKNEVKHLLKNADFVEKSGILQN